MEAKDSPGPWFSTRATKTKFGTESQSHIKDWRNPLKVLRKYKFTQDDTVYYGKVRHGKGYQALFPSDIDPADVLAFIDEWSLK